MTQLNVLHALSSGPKKLYILTWRMSVSAASKQWHCFRALYIGSDKNWSSSQKSIKMAHFCFLFNEIIFFILDIKFIIFNCSQCFLGQEFRPNTRILLTRLLLPFSYILYQQIAIQAAIFFPKNKIILVPDIFFI